MTLLYILTFLNIFWLGFITYGIYRKNKLPKETIAVAGNNNLKINVLRYNPFEDIGGDQSFILTFLDQNNSGVIISSLHNRDITRVYAKPIKNGEGDNITLSKEEKLAIVKTIKG
ncbi:MAG: DUF4446 family protein [Candidatus Shapirobacteria bacterium]|nr:DUF4446 family protein [Candidatus Shapirobacteria bacterium]